MYTIHTTSRKVLELEFKNDYSVLVDKKIKYINIEFNK